VNCELLDRCNNIAERCASTKAGLELPGVWGFNSPVVVMIGSSSLVLHPRGGGLAGTGID